MESFLPLVFITVGFSSLSYAADVLCGNASRAVALKIASEASLAQPDTDKTEPQRTVTLALTAQTTGRQGTFDDSYVLQEFAEGKMVTETKFNVSGQMFVDRCIIFKK